MLFTYLMTLTQLKETKQINVRPHFRKVSNKTSKIGTLLKVYLEAIKL